MIKFAGRKWRVRKEGEVIEVGDRVDYGDGNIRQSVEVIGSVGEIYGSPKFKRFGNGVVWTQVKGNSV